MDVRFVNDEDQDPRLLHRRSLQAKRAREYRRRRKARDSILRSHQANVETQDIEPRQIEPQDVTRFDVEEPAQHDSPVGGMIAWPSDRSDHISEDSIEPEPCHSESAAEDAPEADLEHNNEEVDPHFLEEFEVETESQRPEWYADEQPDLAHHDLRTDVEYATEKFIQQFLVGIYGCVSQEHLNTLTAHIAAEGTDNHHGLDRLFPGTIPHTLDKTQFLPAKDVTKLYALVLANCRSYFVEIQRSNSMAGRSRTAFTPREPKQLHQPLHSTSIASWPL